MQKSWVVPDIFGQELTLPTGDLEAVYMEFKLAHHANFFTSVFTGSPHSVYMSKPERNLMEGLTSC